MSARTIRELGSRGEPVRPRVDGKLLAVGDETFFVRGATYGTFRPRADGSEFPEPDVVERDFGLIAAAGLNAVRTYTIPPRWLLDAAQRASLRVLVGLAAERQAGYLADGKGGPDVRRCVRAGALACAGHPAVLGYAIANEIPAALVRWLGRRRTERWLEALYHAAKDGDPEGLVTYANYPTTEYLELAFLDFIAFNVYLEQPHVFESYLLRLQNRAGDRPLVMTEIGLDSRGHGEEGQARSLEAQVWTSFQTGCAGAFVYAWTDEWHRGGEDVEDWDFGLTRRDRTAKPALRAVQAAFARIPSSLGRTCPRISVVLCSRNGARTIRECLEALTRLEYPCYEVIVVDDGSSDATAAIAGEYDVRLIRTERCGLGSARNTGLEAATGEIVAYIDDDAYPDRHWLSYLALTFSTTDCAGVGGPNLPPPGDGLVAEAVAGSPGNPVHILVSDSDAEHIPGCNMAFRAECLKTIGGFDPRFQAAGDDVDVCWRLRERGWRLAFSPAAVVWHHRRGSLRAYWRQQRGYGRAEGLLAAKWPEKYNGVGHVSWSGRVYGTGPRPSWWKIARVYHGVWGRAAFQSLYEPAAGLGAALLKMPEWHLLSLAFGVLAVLGALWAPLARLASPLLALTAGVSVLEAAVGASRARFKHTARTPIGRWPLFVLTLALHLLQPLARLRGRLQSGLAPWRWTGVGGFALPRARAFAFWTEQWQDPEARLRSIERALQASGVAAGRGGPCDRWDLEVRGGLLGGARLLMAVEEHGSGRQLVRVRAWPVGLLSLMPGALLGMLALWAAKDQAWLVAGVLGLMSLGFSARVVAESGMALASVLSAIGARVPAKTALRPAEEHG